MLTRARLSRFRRDARGVTAVEFALVAPVMILIVMGTIELPRAFSYSQKLTRAARAMADLSARTNLASLNDVYAAGLMIAQPLQTASATIRLAAVGVYTGGNTKVCSSAGYNTAGRPVGTSLGAAPPAFATTGARYVMAEVSITYTPIFTLFPGLNNKVITRYAVWPVRQGNVYYGDPEVVLPNGASCPNT